MNYVVVKLGGSLLSPKEGYFDEKLAKSYFDIIKEIYGSSEKPMSRLVIVVGGGNTSRNYRDIAIACGERDVADEHRIGIAATWLNAELFRSVLSDFAYKYVLGVGVYAENRKEGEERVAANFQEWLKSDKPILVCGGFVTGASTDFNAILLAAKIGAERVYKLTNVEYVYTEYPVTATSQAIKELTWEEYLHLFGADIHGLVHQPGMHIPIDMLAAQLAKENHVDCLLTSGTDPQVIKRIIEGRQTTGTFIRSQQ